jgi:LysM repeat protein
MAAPALAVSGALAAVGPQAFAATAQVHDATPSPKPATQATAVHLDAVVRQADQATRVYTVRSGDTLAGIAQRFYGHASDWQWLYKINRSKISNPNLIYAGQVLRVPTDPPASVRNGTYRARHTKTSGSTTDLAASNTADVTQASSSTGSQSSSGSSSAGLSAVQQDIANGNNLLAIAQYLVANGYSDAGAAGVASCVDGESGGNPESVGSGGGGLIGWTPLGSAAPNANIITGNVEQDMLTQLADILFYNSNEIGQSQVDQLNSISDPVAAADFYSQQFERPAVTDSDVVASVAEQIYAQLSS